MDSTMIMMPLHRPLKKLNQQQNNKNINFTSVETPIAASPFDTVPANDFSDQNKAIRNEALKHKLFECQKELVHYLKIEQKNNPTIKVRKPFHEREALTRWDGYDYERRQILKELKDCKAQLAKYKEKYSNQQDYKNYNINDGRTAYNNKAAYSNINIPVYNRQAVYAAPLSDPLANISNIPECKGYNNLQNNSPASSTSVKSIYDCTLKHCYDPFKCNCYYLGQNKK